MKDNLMRVFNITFAITFIYIIYNAIFNNIYNTWNYSVPIVIISVLAYIGIFLLINKFISKRKNIDNKNIILIFAFVIFLQVIVGTLFQVSPEWDVKDLFETANKIAQGKQISPSYFYTYKNNLEMESIVLLICMIAKAVKFISQYDLAMYINVIMIDMAILFTYLCARKIYDEKKAVTVFLFLILMTPIYLYVPIIYTDTFTMFVPVLLYFLYLKSKEQEKHKILYYTLMGVILAFGMLLKPTTAIIMIAIIIINLIYDKFKDTAKIVISAIPIAIILIVLFNTFMPKIIFKNWDEELYEEQRFPISNWIMMGINGKGAYNTFDYMAMSRIKGYQEKNDFATSKIKERIEKIKKDGINEFLKEKTTYTWGDGAYFAQVMLKISPVRKGVQHEYITVEGQKVVIYKYFSQAEQFAMLILMLFSVLNIKDKNKNILKLSIFGVVLFFLVWETRSRYLANYIPIMTLLSVEGMEQIVLIKNKLKNKIQEKIANQKKKKTHNEFQQKISSDSIKQ